jgi:hypothetical protein
MNLSSSVFKSGWEMRKYVGKRRKLKRKKQVNYLNIAFALQLHFQLNYRLNWKG